MNTAVNINWMPICNSRELIPNIGVCALVKGQQVAIFKVGDKLYAIDNHDPFSNANVLARGIVGDLKGQFVVASPIYKQHFNLETGQCLEDDDVRLNVFHVRDENGTVQIAA